MSVTETNVEVVVVGAGFSGIGMAIKLDEAGLNDYVIIEAGDGVGGTWHFNTYPGVAVDIPSFTYQFSFEQKSDWSRTYAKGSELKAYADHCVRKYYLESKIRFNTTVVAADYDTDSAVWKLRVDSGEVIATRFLINATGVFATPALPDIDGVDSFAGITMHTARWDHDQDLSGKNVAVIGTGASAVQLIPEIAPIVKNMSVFQRTPVWCIPKVDLPLPKPLRWLLRVPAVRSASRLLSHAYIEFTFPVLAHYFKFFPLAKWTAPVCRAYLRSQVHDATLREKLTPSYILGCKRGAFTNTYLATYNRDNVELVTEPIEKITSSALVTVDGTEHEVDAIVLATGFQKVLDTDTLTTYPVRGEHGKLLSQFWEERRMQAYEGVSVPGFPNMFLIFGPYGYVAGSYFSLIEAQTHHIVRCLQHARRRHATRVEVTEEANARYFAEMLRRRRRGVFWHESCRSANSYYFDKNGDVTFRPTTTIEAAWRSRSYNLDDYQFTA